MAVTGEWNMGITLQCCPMDTYDTDSAGMLRPVCSCGDGCDCLCLGCLCRAQDDDETGDLACPGPGAAPGAAGFPFPLADPMPEPVMVSRPCGCTSMVTDPGNPKPIQVSWCVDHDPGYEPPASPAVWIRS